MDRLARRNRKTRHRKPRFSNRIHSKHKGWLAPSIENKIHTHIKTVSNVHRILPITMTIVEVASFDIQKIKNPDIPGVGYQQGGRLGSWNVREYVLFRDGHRRSVRKGCKNPILRVHYIYCFSCKTAFFC
ncbi:MAG: RRXRR domain-containing protein [Clostridiales bacterium]|nr:RRXRR domain-containing protein [Clostridiales bacterium]